MGKQGYRPALNREKALKDKHLHKAFDALFEVSNIPARPPLNKEIAYQALLDWHNAPRTSGDEEEDDSSPNWIWQNTTHDPIGYLQHSRLPHLPPNHMDSRVQVAYIKKGGPGRGIQKKRRAYKFLSLRNPDALSLNAPTMNASVEEEGTHLSDSGTSAPASPNSQDPGLESNDPQDQLEDFAPLRELPNDVNTQQGPEFIPRDLEQIRGAPDLEQQEGCRDTSISAPTGLDGKQYGQRAVNNPQPQTPPSLANVSHKRPFWSRT